MQPSKLHCSIWRNQVSDFPFFVFFLSKGNFQDFYCTIMKTCLYNTDPLKPHFYIVKLGLIEVYIIFLISAQKHILWVHVRTAKYQQSMFLSRNMKKNISFYLKIFSFWRWIYSVYLNRHVFVMQCSVSPWSDCIDAVWSGSSLSPFAIMTLFSCKYCFRKLDTLLGEATWSKVFLSPLWKWSNNIKEKNFFILLFIYNITLRYTLNNLTLVTLIKLWCHADFSNYQPIRLLNSDCGYKFTYWMTNRIQ